MYNTDKCKSLHFGNKNVKSVDLLGDISISADKEEKDFVLCRHRQQLYTASVRRHPVSQSGKRNHESTPIFCSRLYSKLLK